MKQCTNQSNNIDEYFHNLSVRYFQAKDHNTSLTLAYKTLSTLEGRII